MRLLLRLVAAFALLTASAFAQSFPAPKTGEWIAKDFKFHTGETLAEVKLAYTTIGDPKGEPVLILHGTSGNAGSMLGAPFAGVLFGPGQPLDAAKYYIIIPDALGHGKSSKPSDGMRAKFPRYNYDDMVSAQHRLVTEGLGVKHLRLVIGNSMGGMHTWIWGAAHPTMMDALVPMAAQPTEMSARNWMMRRLIIDTIRTDPEWNGGNYTAQPKAFKMANVFYGIGTSGGTLAWSSLAPTRAAADKIVDERLAAPFTADANDFLYAWDSSRDYNAAPKLDRIQAALLAINSADDERNPPETGVMERELKRIKGAKLLLIPASTDTRGHGTTGMARFWSTELKAFLEATPRKAM